MNSHEIRPTAVASIACTMYESALEKKRPRPEMRNVNGLCVFETVVLIILQWAERSNE